MTEVTTPVRPGDCVAGKYRVDGVLGVGGMGVVVAATHEQLDQKVALKFLLPEVLSRPEVVARFLREARAAVKIRSEHVARVIDVGALETGAPYMVMEYLEGEDIEHVLERRGPLPLDESVGYVLEACEAIAEAHALGIVHRDLKPANLFLAKGPGGKPIVKVLDFGISKLPLSDREQALTKDTSLMGSPAYMSPEQLKASRDVDARSDIWSLGIVLYEVLTQKVPFAHEAMGALVAAVMYDPHQPVRVARTDIPAAFEGVLDRCLAKDPASRYANIAEMARALLPFGPPRGDQSVERIEHALGHVSHVSDAPAAPTAPTAPTSVTAISDVQMERSALSATILEPKKRRGKLVVFLALGGLLSVAAVVGYTLRPAPPKSAPAQVVAPEPPPASASVAVPVETTTVTPALPSASSLATSDPTSVTPLGPKLFGKLPGHVPSAVPTTTPAPTAAPTCKVITSFDSEGNKHFKQECQ